MIYFNAQGETREIDDALYAAWVAAANPKAQEWMRQPQPPTHNPQTETCTWDGTAWVVAPLPPAPVPDSLPRHIAEEVLLRQPHAVHGTQWDAVLALVASLPADQRRIFEARLNAPSIRRTSTTVASIAAGLGWSDEWVDDRFREGAVLEGIV